MNIQVVYINVYRLIDIIQLFSISYDSHTVLKCCLPYTRKLWSELLTIYYTLFDVCLHLPTTHGPFTVRGGSCSSLLMGRAMNFLTYGEGHELL